MRSHLALCLAALLIAANAPAANCSLKPKQVVTKFMTSFYVDKKVREAFETWVDPGYIQHNPLAETGRELFMKGDFTQAMLEFERGRDLDPNPDFDYALGQVFVKLGDITRHRFIDPLLQLLHQRQAGGKQVARGLGAAAQALVDEFAAFGVKPVQRCVQFGIETGHVRKAVRRIEVENSHQTAIAVERLVTPILHHA